MDSNGFKALAFLHFYLCGVVAVYTGYQDGPAAFATLVTSSVLLTTCVISALWIHEWRARDPSALRAFGPGAARAAVVVGWASLVISMVTRSYTIVYAAYIALLVLLVYRARTMEAEESGYEETLRAEA
jgi:phosphatidylserine synthase